MKTLSEKAKDMKLGAFEWQISTVGTVKNNKQEIQKEEGRLGKRVKEWSGVIQVTKMSQGLPRTMITAKKYELVISLNVLLNLR